MKQSLHLPIQLPIPKFSIPYCVQISFYETQELSLHFFYRSTWMCYFNYVCLKKSLFCLHFWKYMYFKAMNSRFGVCQVFSSLSMHLKYFSIVLLLTLFWVKNLLHTYIYFIVHIFSHYLLYNFFSWFVILSGI